MSKLTLNVYYDLKECNGAEFVRELEESGVADLVRAEKGCITYRYFLPADDAKEVLLVEEWEDEADQAVHITQPHMTQLRAIKDRYADGTRLVRFAE